MSSARPADQEERPASAGRPASEGAKNHLASTGYAPYFYGSIFLLSV
jgi:hypothetical protein